jgi:spermidine synthase
VRFAAFAAFFLSGASSLIFQNIWARMLHHVFGATGVAISTVVTVFMAGLGLGAFVAGRFVDRMRRPLLGYAVVELGVAAWALLVPTLLDPEGWLAEVNRFLRAELGAESLGFMLARFACVAPVLLLPTTLMGASLPLLARHFVRAEEHGGRIGSSVGALYAVNTFGAVAGVFLAGFVLMPTVGVTATNLVAVGINLLLGVGIAAAVLMGPAVVARGRAAARATPTKDAQGTDSGRAHVPPSDAAEALALPRWVRGVALFTFGASGAAALAYEVVWTRALAMTIGASIYSFALILDTFLIGIAAGSALASAVLVGRGRLLGGAAAASVALAPLAAAPWAFTEGPLTWALVTALLVAGVLLTHRVGVSRLRAAHLPGAPAPVLGPAVLMLAFPFGAAVLAAVLAPGRLPHMVVAVVGTIAACTIALVVSRRTPVLQLALVQLYVGAATFANYLFQDQIPCAFAGMVASLPNTADHVAQVQLFMFLTAALCTLPATLGMGAMFPLTLRLWTASGAAVGRDVGVVYASNTLGSIAGAWLPGFVLMPLWGLERTLHAGIWLNLALALLLVVASTARGASPAAPSSRTRWREVGAYGLAVLLPVLGALLYLGTARPDSPLRWNLSRMTLGVFRISAAQDACDPEVWGHPDIVYYRDGLVTTVSVERWGHHLAMKNNGKVEASNGDDMPTQIMVSAYPLLMHPRGPEGLSVAVVGFGSGVSVGAALQFPVEHVDVVELERAVVESSIWFREVNHMDYELDRFPYVTNPRLSVHNDDGRAFLAAEKRTYDVIVSEPSNPWITGVSDLFTEEHFRITRRRLATGGIYCQWVQLYELSPLNIKTIMRTFASHFDHVVVFAADDFSSDTILLGSDEPLPFDLDRVRRAMAHPEVTAELERAFVYAPHDVLARVLLADRDEVMRFTLVEERFEGGRWVPYAARANAPGSPCEEGCRRVPAPLNTDDNARIEFSAPRDLIGYERYRGYLAELYTAEWPYGQLSERLRGLPDDPAEASAEYARMAMALGAHGRKDRAAQMVERARRAGSSPEADMAWEVLSLLTDDAHEPAPPLAPPVPGPSITAAQKRQLMSTYDAILTALHGRAYEPALTALQAVPAPLRIHSGPAFRFLHGYLLYKTGAADRDRFVQSSSELEELLHSEERWVALHPEVLYFLARALDEAAEHDRALGAMRRYVDARREAGEAEAAAAAN